MDEERKIKIGKLEDLVAWQKARNLMKIVYKITTDFPASERYNITKHLRECSRNIPGNIAEGFGRFHYQESMQFYRIARGSLLELKSDLYCSLDNNFLTKDDFEIALKQTEKVLALLNGLIKSVIKVKNTS